MSVITFDFDDTLTQPVWNEKYGLFEPSEAPNLESIAKLKEFHRQGKDVKIVTTRWRDEEVLTFVREYRLPISSVHCTQGELKAIKLKELNSQLHFDDNEAEALANLRLKIPTVVVSFSFDASSNRAVCHFKAYESESS
ncbi:MAG: HAD family hydrolase [Cyanobacteria bacterium J06555_13]